MINDHLIITIVLSAYKSIRKWRNAWCDFHEIIYYQWRAVNGLQVMTGTPGSYKIRWMGIKVVRDLSCSRTLQTQFNNSCPPYLTDSPSFHLYSLVYNTNAGSHLLTVLPNDEWKDWSEKWLSSHFTMHPSMFMDLSNLLHTSKYWRSLWLPPQELLKSMRFLFTTQFIEMELTHFYYIYYCLSQEQAHSFTFLMHACKWKLSLLCYCLQPCLDKSFITV